ncbi:TcmI family type II polyketide cyclase [Streptomyces sp. LX-29]|uniref:TcmI family type II polyketide cyclase n=1 Tax=Streptomyces sp. LX-29 TaxID=2900152 RepID=UPI00240CF70D|nr:TcmI family type II polyketide cyclase [Streptomyces sp. LX-29]WFB09098.1 TcmI family type II polyketide cyclase [Streptomyces sp. LX-29]
MHRTLIVARMNPEDVAGVSEVFRWSDGTELPHLIGVRRRTLFRFHDLYLHLVEADGEDTTERLYEHRRHPLFQEIHERLLPYIRPYDPNWSEPRHAMAVPFYRWENERD